MRTALTILLLLTGSALAQNTIGFSRTARRYDRDQLGKVSVMPTILFTNSVMWQTFSKDDGTNYFDFADTNNGATNVPPAWTNAMGGAVIFSGTNFIKVTAANSLAGSNALAVACWVRMSTLAGNQAFITKYQNSGAYPGWGFRMANATGKLEFWHGGASWKTSTGSGLATGTWQHATAVWNAGALTFYINGTQNYATNGLSLIPAHTAHDAFLAQDPGGNNRLNGWIADVALFNRVLTSNEVVNLYNSTKGTYGY